MKNTMMQRFAGLLAAVALLLASCTDEEFVREGGVAPDGEALITVAAELYRLNPIDSRIILTGADVTDVLRVRLTMPAGKDLGLTIAVDAAQFENHPSAKDFTLFPTDHVILLTPSDIAAGETESGDIVVSFDREGVEKGRYLLPLTARIDGAEEAASTVFYEIIVADPSEDEIYAEHSLGFKTVGYLNTEVMNPIFAIKFPLRLMAIISPEVKYYRWLDLVALRKSTLGVNSATGRLELKLGPDLQYVMNNRHTYIDDIQRTGRKLLLCINGELGFCALTDEQIADFVYQIKKVIEKYRFDGVNFFDTERIYAEDGMPAVIPASYTKLLKATKEALGDDRLVTVACDAQSTDLLAAAHDGIEAGRYIDYAWPAIFDKPIDPWDGDAELKPIAGLDRSKYGGVTLQTHTTSWNVEHRQELTAAINSFYPAHAESANVFAFWDMPARDAGIEGGPIGAFTYVTSLFSYSDDPDIEKWYLYDIELRKDIIYGAYRKDW